MAKSEIDARYAASAAGDSVIRPRQRQALWLALFSGLLMAAMTACAPASRRGDIAGGSNGTNMSPEACMVNASLQRPSDAHGAYLIQPGDDLFIDFYLSPEFNQEVTVRPDGKIALRLVGVVQAASLTPQQLAANLDQAYLSELRDPGVTVVVKNMPSREVFVEGEVQHPGAFPAEQGMTALQAVAKAGGFTQDAASTAVLIRRDACGQASRSVIDLSDAVKHPDRDDDLVLQSRDILVVPLSGVASVDEWVDHYIRRLLPIQPYFAATAATPPL
jgi:polysaccharide export outer membrane protein